MRNLFKLKSSKSEGKVRNKKQPVQDLDETHEEIQIMPPPPKGKYGDNDEDLGYC